MPLPSVLTDLLISQYQSNVMEQIIEGYKASRPVTLRVNTLKADADEVISALRKIGALCKRVPWYKDAFIIENVSKDDISHMEIYKGGKIYLQSLSSMIPPLILDPHTGESVLDMCAAPGGKTTEMAALSGGSADITACEKNKIRGDKLKYNLQRQGAGRVSVMVTDARRLDDFFRFDKILLDAPCSGSGTISPDSKSFTSELYERSMRTQSELLKKAIKVLKPGGKMVYSTCSVLAGENEDIIAPTVKSGTLKVLPISEENFLGIYSLPTKIPGTLAICPDNLHEGFFVAFLEKNK